MPPRKILLDMDPGVDDALAILLALRSPELHILGLTAVAGNAPLEMTARNALRILEAAGALDIPVAAGAARPLVRELATALHVHGNDGLGGADVPGPSRLALTDETAVDFIVRTVRSHDPGEITLVPTGPLTNVAAAFLAAPDLPERLEKVVLMGGAFAVSPHGHGNVTPVSEFNIWVDPEAADIVFRSGVAVTAVGLDVTTDPASSLTPLLSERLRQGNDPFGRLAALVAEDYMTRFGVAQMHDPMAVGFLIDPTLFQTETHPVEVVFGEGSTQGQTIADRRGRPSNAPSITVCTTVDGPRFLDLFMTRLTAEG